MKNDRRIGWFLLLWGILAGCQSPFYLNQMGYEIQEKELKPSWQYIASFEYIAEADGYNYVKSPKEFEHDGGGDCEDFSVALMYLLGPTSKGVSIKTPNGNHYIVKYNDIYLEPQRYRKYYSESALEILHVYSYDFMMEWATDCGRKSVWSF